MVIKKEHIETNRNWNKFIIWTRERSKKFTFQFRLFIFIFLFFLSFFWHWKLETSISSTFIFNVISKWCVIKLPKIEFMLIYNWVFDYLSKANLLSISAIPISMMHPNPHRVQYNLNTLWFIVWFLFNWTVWTWTHVTCSRCCCCCQTLYRLLYAQCTICVILVYIYTICFGMNNKSSYRTHFSIYGANYQNRNIDFRLNTIK